MKIGILTYHFAINYGAVLQCYALQQTLYELGYDDVEVINYNTYNWRLLFQNLPHRFCKDLFRKSLIKFSHYNASDKAFKDFVEKYIHCTQLVSMHDIAEKTKQYDVIIVGSDQVWAPRMRVRSPYFLDWTPSYTGKRIAYAPCCMTKQTRKDLFNKLSSALNKFDALSVRDKETQQFVYNLTKEIPIQVPDPTILYDFHDLLSYEPLIKEPYIFAYILGNDIKGSNKAAMTRIREFYPQAKIYAVTLPKTNPVDVSWADKVIYDASPVDWLNMIQHAQLVFTDSFHAAIFSLKLKTPFYAYYSMESRKSRFIDLIEQFDLGDYVISHIDDIRRISSPVRIDENNYEIYKRTGIGYIKEVLK